MFEALGPCESDYLKNLPKPLEYSCPSSNSYEVALA